MLVYSQPGSARKQIRSREHNRLPSQYLGRSGRTSKELVPIGSDHQRIVVKLLEIEDQSAHDYRLPRTTGCPACECADDSFRISQSPSVIKPLVQVRGTRFTESLSTLQRKEAGCVVSAYLLCYVAFFECSLYFNPSMTLAVA